MDTSGLQLIPAQFTGLRLLFSKTMKGFRHREWLKHSWKRLSICDAKTKWGGGETNEELMRVDGGGEQAMAGGALEGDCEGVRVS